VQLTPAGFGTACGPLTHPHGPHRTELQRHPGWAASCSRCSPHAAELLQRHRWIYCCHRCHCCCCCWPPPRTTARSGSRTLGKGGERGRGSSSTTQTVVEHTIVQRLCRAMPVSNALPFSCLTHESNFSAILNATLGRAPPPTHTPLHEPLRNCIFDSRCLQMILHASDLGCTHAPPTRALGQQPYIPGFSARDPAIPLASVGMLMHLRAVQSHTTQHIVRYQATPPLTPHPAAALAAHSVPKGLGMASVVVLSHLGSVQAKCPLSLVTTHTRTHSLWSPTFMSHQHAPPG